MFIILLPYVLIVFEPYGQGLFSITMILGLVMIGYYVFGGLHKLTVNFIYGAITIIFLAVLPEPYQVAIALTSAAIFLVNPLQRFEKYLEKSLLPEEVHPIQINISGSYWPYFEYRKDMKEYYHLPQSKKLHTKKNYLRWRQFTTITLLFLATFLFINEIGSITNNLYDFKWDNFFVFYNVIWIYLMAFYAFKKGFTTVFRALVIGTIPIVIYLVLISNFDPLFKYITLGVVLVLSAVIIVTEVIKYYQRVSFDTYVYDDHELGMKVYANALFEPLVYNDTFVLSTEYRIRISVETFHKQLQTILIIANMKRILITAYAYSHQMLHLYADFHYLDRKKVDLFKTFLESQFKMAIPYEVVEDRHKVLYERKFFHRTPYIVARAKHLADLLKDVSGEVFIIITTIMYFESKQDLNAFNTHYQTTTLSDIKVDDYVSVKVDIPIVNTENMVEKTVLELLETMKQHQGKFVRILVYKLAKSDI
jgi:hypothetical protein